MQIPDKKLISGHKLPVFVLEDLAGEMFSSESLLGHKNMLIVFNRGFMCPFCRKHLAQLRRFYDDFIRRDTEIVVIGPEKKKAFKNYWRKEYLPFVGLPDPERAVLDRFGQEVSLIKLGRLPAQTLVDKRGIIRYSYYGQSMKDIPPVETTLKAAEEVNGLKD
jgi:peroxiredoxin Q/BCP